MDILSEVDEEEIAELLFGDEDALIQPDRSEYIEKHTVSRLIGSPPTTTVGV